MSSVHRPSVFRNMFRSPSVANSSPETMAQSPPFSQSPTVSQPECANPTPQMAQEPTCASETLNNDQLSLQKEPPPHQALSTTLEDSNVVQNAESLTFYDSITGQHVYYDGYGGVYYYITEDGKAVAVATADGVRLDANTDPQIYEYYQQVANAALAAYISNNTISPSVPEAEDKTAISQTELTQNTVSAQPESAHLDTNLDGSSNQTVTTSSYNPAIDDPFAGSLISRSYSSPTSSNVVSQKPPTRPISSPQVPMMRSFSQTSIPRPSVSNAANRATIMIPGHPENIEQFLSRVKNGEIKSGVLLKLGGKKPFLEWQPRRCVVTTDAKLQYYDPKRTKNSLRGELNLKGVKCEIIEPSHEQYNRLRKYTLKMSGGKDKAAETGYLSIKPADVSKTYYLAIAKSDLQDWHQVITSAEAAEKAFKENETMKLKLQYQQQQEQKMMQQQRQEMIETNQSVQPQASAPPTYEPTPSITEMGQAGHEQTNTSASSVSIQPLATTSMTQAPDTPAAHVSVSAGIPDVFAFSNQVQQAEFFGLNTVQHTGDEFVFDEAPT